MNRSQSIPSSTKKNSNTAILRIFGPSVDDAILSYVRRVRTMNDFQESHDAFETFQKAYYAWSPPSIACIKPCDKATLDVIFHHSDGLDMNMPVNQGMVKFQKKIAGLVAEWRERMGQEDYLTFGNLQQLLVAMKSSTWDSYVNFFITRDRVNDKRYMYLAGCALPEIELIQSQVDEIRRLNEQRQNRIVVSIHGQTYTNIEMLHAYDCLANTDTLIRFKVHDVTSQKATSKYSLENDLFDINTIYDISGKDQNQLCDWLYICSYFHKYPSMLFGEMKYQGNDGSTAKFHGDSTPGHGTNVTPAGQWPNIHTFVKAVAEKRIEIQQLFSDKMSYTNVAHALQTTLTSDAIIEAEVKVLMNCDKLRITASDVTHFRIVKLLHDYAQPLQNFVEICARHNFRLVHLGDTFRSLQMDVVKFYSFTDHHSRDDCIQFFNRLYDVFCPRDTQKNGDGTSTSDVHRMVQTYVMELHKIDELTKVLSWLLPLTYVSYGPSVWQYVALDMKWCGEEGYSRFNDIYQDVHNTLTEYSHSASNERSVLENVVPVIRLFTIIGQCKDTCLSVKELLQNFQSSDKDDLQNCMKVPFLGRYIHEANSRIEAIRELLNSGATIVDDEQMGHPAEIPMLRLPPPSGDMKTKLMMKPPMTYGTLAEEYKMRSWLDEQGLSSSVGDLFVSSGIRTMDDVRIFSTLSDHDVKETMSTLPILDRTKLLIAMKPLTTSVASSTKTTDAPESSKKRKSGLFF